MNRSGRLTLARRVALGLLATVAMAIASIVYIVGWGVYAAGWGDDEPYFYTKNGSYRYDCLNEVTGEPGAIAIEFTQNGRKARVIDSGRSLVLDFEVGGLAGDHYTAGDARLEIDPEVYVRGVGDRDLGPCQRM